MGNKKKIGLMIGALVLLGLVLAGSLMAYNINKTPTATSSSLSPVKQSRPTESTNAVAFESLGKGYTFVARLETPAVFVAGNLAEASQFTRLLGGQRDEISVIRRIQEVDFSTAWVVAVFSGQKGSSGYSITIKEVSKAPGIVRLLVEETQPAPDRAVQTIITYPYHIILLPKEKLPLDLGTTWSVYTPDGTLLTQTKYP